MLCATQASPGPALRDSSEPRLEPLTRRCQPRGGCPGRRGISWRRLRYDGQAVGKNARPDADREGEQPLPRSSDKLTPAPPGRAPAALSAQHMARTTRPAFSQSPVPEPPRLYERARRSSCSSRDLHTGILDVTGFSRAVFFTLRADRRPCPRSRQTSADLLIAIPQVVRVGPPLRS